MFLHLVHLSSFKFEVTVVNICTCGMKEKDNMRHEGTSEK
jgi:hypothetical protein